MDTASLHDPVEGLYDARIRGTCLIGTGVEGRVHLHGGCWLAPVSDHPPQMMAAFPMEFEGAELVAQSRAFTVSFVSTEQRRWFGSFFARGNVIDAKSRQHFLRAPSGLPVLAEGTAYLDCRVDEMVDLGDFRLVLGPVAGGAPLVSHADNLTVNEIIREHDPRRDSNEQLPFRGFDFDTAQLPPAPEWGGATPERFHSIALHRQWGLFLAHSADFERFWLSGRVIQTSHRPARMAVVLPDGWDASGLRSERIVLTLPLQEQWEWLSWLTADPDRALLREEWDPGTGRLRRGLGWFDCRVQSRHTVGGKTVAIATVEEFAPLDPNAVNLTQGDWNRLGFDSRLDVMHRLER